MQEGSNVVCPLPTFQLLMDGLATYRAELQICALKSRQLQDELNLCNAKVKELSAQLPCPVLAQPDPSKPVWGYAVGVVSAAAVAASVLLPMPAEARAGLALGGLAGLGLGVVLVLP